MPQPSNIVKRLIILLYKCVTFMKRRVYCGAKPMPGSRRDKAHHTVETYQLFTSVNTCFFCGGLIEEIEGALRTHLKQCDDLLYFLKFKENHMFDQSKIID